MASINEQFKRIDELITGHIGELASGYAWTGENYDLRNWGDKELLAPELERWSVIAGKLAVCFRSSLNAGEEREFARIIEELETIVW
jgi:hypothetical protein